MWFLIKAYFYTTIMQFVNMMKSWQGNVFCVIGRLWDNSLVLQWIHSHKGTIMRNFYSFFFIGSDKLSNNLRGLTPHVTPQIISYLVIKGEESEIEFACAAQVGDGGPEDGAIVADHGQALSVHLVTIVIHPEKNNNGNLIGCKIKSLI